MHRRWAEIRELSELRVTEEDNLISLILLLREEAEIFSIKKNTKKKECEPFTRYHGILVNDWAP